MLHKDHINMKNDKQQREDSSTTTRPSKKMKLQKLKQREYDVMNKLC